MADKPTSITLASKYRETSHHGRHEKSEYFDLIVDETASIAVLEHLVINRDTMNPDGEHRETRRYRLTCDALVELIVSSVKPE